MIALDTNVIVRFLVRDDRRQAEAARALLKSLTAECPGFVGREVAVELVCVLERAYRISRQRVAAVLEELVATAELVIEAGDDVAQAASRYRASGTGFSDLMVLAAARRSGAHPVYTFDRKAARLEGVTLLGSRQA